MENQTARLSARVTGTTRYTIQVELPHTILLDEDTDDYFFKSCKKNNVDQLGCWNGELDCIKEQLPSEKIIFSEVMKKANEGRCSFKRDWFFKPTNVSWEEN